MQAILGEWLLVLQRGLHELQLVSRDLQYVAAAAADAESNSEACVQLKVNQIPKHRICRLSHGAAGGLCLHQEMVSDQVILGGLVELQA